MADVTLSHGGTLAVTSTSNRCILESGAKTFIIRNKGAGPTVYINLNGNPVNANTNAENGKVWLEDNEELVTNVKIFQYATAGVDVSLLLVIEREKY